MAFELVLVELLDTFAVMFAVVGKSVDGDLRCFFLGVTLVDKSDGVLHRQVVE